MGLTTNRNDPNLQKIRTDGQQETYLVLSEEELAKGFVRPVRTSYKHLVCGAVTTMGLTLSQTYARDPKFYSGTFCCNCQKHFNLVDKDGLPAFVWQPDGDPVGFNAEEAKLFFEKKKQRESQKHLGDNI